MSDSDTPDQIAVARNLTAQAELLALCITAVRDGRWDGHSESLLLTAILGLDALAADVQQSSHEGDVMITAALVKLREWRETKMSERRLRFIVEAYTDVMYGASDVMSSLPGGSYNN